MAGGRDRWDRWRERAKVDGMDIAALAALAGNALVTAAATDAWEDVRHKIAGIFGRGRPDPQIERRFDTTKAVLEAAGSPGEAEKARADLAASWTARLTVLLEDHPDACDELDELVQEIRGSAAVASDHAVATGRDVNITASGGGVGAGLIHGNVTAGPTGPGPAYS
jgi:hypothetical protein